MATLLERRKAYTFYKPFVYYAYVKYNQCKSIYELKFNLDVNVKTEDEISKNYVRRHHFIHTVL